MLPPRGRASASLTPRGFPEVPFGYFLGSPWSAALLGASLMGPGRQVLCHRDRAAHPGLWGARTGWRPTSGSPATGCLTRHQAGAGSELGFSGSRLKINMERSNDGKGRVACPGSWQPEGGRATAPEPRGPRGRQREDGRQQEQAWRPVWRCPSWVRAQEAHPGEAGPPGLDTSLCISEQVGQLCYRSRDSGGQASSAGAQSKPEGPWERVTARCAGFPAGTRLRDGHGSVVGQARLVRRLGLGAQTGSGGHADGASAGLLWPR